MEEYSYIFGIKKSLKDGLTTGLASAITIFLIFGEQIMTQCPDLSFSIFGMVVGFKTIFTFITNWAKHNIE